MTDNLGADSLWMQAWKLLVSAASGDHPAYATPVVATQSASGVPRQRTIVLRRADFAKGELYCYTDRRSVKVAHLAERSVLSWLFWDGENQLQFTGHGPTRWLGDHETQNIFARLPKHARKAYATQLAPSSEVPKASSGLPQDWDERSLTQTDFALKNFGVLVTTLQRAEILKLDRKGNLRLSATKNNEQWEFSWIIP